MWEKARITGQAGIRKTSVVAVDVSKQIGWHRNRGRWIVRDEPAGRFGQPAQHPHKDQQPLHNQNSLHAFHIWCGHGKCGAYGRDGMYRDSASQLGMHGLGKRADPRHTGV
jgi:hypothetical protein